MSAAPSMRNTHASAVQSPCISVCELDEVSGLCTGCARTIDEIAGWGRFTDSRKREVLAALPARHARIREASGHGER